MKVSKMNWFKKGLFGQERRSHFNSKTSRIIVLNKYQVPMSNLCSRKSVGETYSKQGFSRFTATFLSKIGLSGVTNNSIDLTKKLEFIWV
jgi:hypothetical protein